MSYKLSDYHYILPPDRIAQHPLNPAHDAKLLVADCRDETMILSDQYFSDLPALLDPGTLLIANNSQVFASRIILHDVQVILNNWTEVLLGQGELLIVRVLFDEEGNLDKNHCVAWFSDKKHCRPWTTILLNKNKIYSQKFLDDGILIELEWIDLIALCDQYGDMPLPPYITQATAEDKVRYKTSFGHELWSVATPTAGLHFTTELRQKLQQNNIQREEITLHVGIGTFAPVVSEDIRDHQLHAEYITIDTTLFERIYRQKLSWKPIITIGTTSTRTIESLPYLFRLMSDKLKLLLSPDVYDWRYKYSQDWWDRYIVYIHIQSNKISFSSSLFIYPWFERKLIDWLITNFHLPGTSLVMLVAGLVWYTHRQQSYTHALAFDYRFASFGDGMLIKLWSL